MYRPIASCVTWAAVALGCDNTQIPAVLRAEMDDLEPLYQVVQRRLIGDTVVFGSIDDVTAEEDGGVYVIDAFNKHLVRISVGNRHIKTTAAAGRGPGEIYHARAMAQDTLLDRLYVLDDGNLKILIYDTSSDDMVFRQEARIGVPLHDMCVLRSRLFGVGALEGKLVHEFASDGGILQSFALPIGDTPTRALAIEARGHLVCDEAANAIVVVPAIYPIVRAFSPDGDLLWQTTLSHYHPWIPTRSARSFTMTTDGTGISHVAMSAVLPRDGTIMIQLGVRSDDRGGELLMFDSRFLSMASGHQVGRQIDLPLVKDIVGGAAYGVQSDPYPLVAVWMMEKL